MREDVGDLREWVDEFERDVHCLIAQCHTPPDDRPASITLTVS